jgi:hypothetical protein
MDDHYKYEEAKKRVKKKKGFYAHFASYLIINTIFFFIVFLNSGTFAWLYPASFWGIGLAMHYLGVFGFPGAGGVGGSDWEAEEIQKEMDKMEGRTEEIPNEELELREIEKRKQDWNDNDLV